MLYDKFWYVQVLLGGWVTLPVDVFVNPVLPDIPAAIVGETFFTYVCRSAGLSKRVDVSEPHPAVKHAVPYRFYVIPPTRLWVLVQIQGKAQVKDFRHKR